MIKFLKNRTWDDYVIATVLITIFLGLFLFVIGFFWGFEDKSIIFLNGKTSVMKLLKKDDLEWMSSNGFEFVSIDNSNLFIMMKDLNKDMGSLYSMVALSVSGFAFIMLGLSELILIILGSFLFEFVYYKIKKNRNKS